MNQHPGTRAREHRPAGVHRDRPGRHRPETLQNFAIPVALFRLRADRAGEGIR